MRCTRKRQSSCNMQLHALPGKPMQLWEERFKVHVNIRIGLVIVVIAIITLIDMSEFWINWSYLENETLMHQCTKKIKKQQ